MADDTRTRPEGLTTDDPELARAEIAQTRARMSETIDEIEDALLRRKERIQNRMDLLAPVRERPLQAAAVALGAGLLLGLLTGGGDDEEDEDDLEVEFEFDPDLVHRMGAGALGARRAFSYAHEDEEYADDEDENDEEDEDVSGVFGGLRELVAERARPLVGGLMRQLLDGNRRS